MKKIEVTPDPTYRTADENAVSLKEIIDLLADESIASNEDFELLHNVTKRVEHFGVYVEEYEQKISKMRNLIEKSYPYMTLNTFKQNVPKKTIREFKEVMSDVSAWVRRNKHDRE
tara:strand:+ start:3599 stop:3943 length:345 start_codon:yes stop_codon:yes gene_type:complete